MCVAPFTTAPTEVLPGQVRDGSGALQGWQSFLCRCRTPFRSVIAVVAWLRLTATAGGIESCANIHYAPSLNHHYMAIRVDLPEKEQAHTIEAALPPHNVVQTPQATN